MGRRKPLRIRDVVWCAECDYPVSKGICLQCGKSVRGGPIGPHWWESPGRPTSEEARAFPRDSRGKWTGTRVAR